MIRFLPVHLPVILLLGFAGHSRAARFTLDSAVPYALRNNPELAAARLSIAEARGRLAQAGRLPNPELESAIRPNVRGREYSAEIGFVQKFPLTNRLRLERAVSGAALAAAEAEVRVAERTLAAGVRSIGIRMLSVHATRALKERQVAVSRELSETARRLAGTGEGSGLEATQFEMESRQLALDLLLLEAEQASLAGEARPLLGIPPGEPLEFTGSLPAVVVPGGAAPDVRTRPEVQAAEARAEAARRNVDLARAGRWEDAAIGLSAEIERAEDAPDGLETDHIVGIRFSLPLPFWNRNAGAIAEAEATAARTSKEVEALVARVRAEAAAAMEEMRAARKIADELSRNLLPEARRVEAQLAEWYQQGQPGVAPADVLRAGQKRLELEQAHIDAIRTFWLARIRWEAASGR